jgi:hypothetical protein
MYTWREKCASCISTGKDTCSWTIEPTRGAPGRSAVHPIDDPVAHACFRGLRAPHVLHRSRRPSGPSCMWSASNNSFVRPAKTSVPSSIGPTAPPRDTPNDTNMADETRRRVRSMVLDRICRCLRRLQAPHVYSTSSYSSKRYTWDQLLLCTNRQRHLPKGPSSRRAARQAGVSSTR